ncbi:MAG: hypothetical protein EG825_13235 [Rhodocyclaceae bacterium]|nr:hypothetical protein [Rhodocyclaceae bacterium]
MPVPSLFSQLMQGAAAAASAKTEKPAWPLNPFPTGIREGSATDRVLTELKRVAPQPLDAGQLRHRCGVSRGALAWAVRYLQDTGQIRAVPRPGRHPQYLRYQFIKE